ncbi:hypothetical protein FOCC_FOCC007366 [Frankliniella occidentalis]|nr:hypothetical protein FOCC_FOCC007366 [Frankliniella occidentalis]
MLTAARASGPGQQQHVVGHPDPGLEHIDLDQLFLLPVRVLSMDSASLRKDLAGLDFNVHLLHNGPQGNVWLCECGCLDRGLPLDCDEALGGTSLFSTAFLSTKGIEDWTERVEFGRGL